MFSLHTSVGRVWRLLLSGLVASCAALTTAQAQSGDPPPLLDDLVIWSGRGAIGFINAPLSPTFISHIDHLVYDISIPFEHTELWFPPDTTSTVNPGHAWDVPDIPTLLAGQITQFTITVSGGFGGFGGGEPTEYIINVTRGVSNDVAVLSNLVISGATLSPGFDPLTFDYTGFVPNETTSITVTPTAQAAETSSTTVNGIPVDSGSASGTIDLIEGSNEIIVRVMDGDVTKAYVITITRLPPKADSDGDGMEDGFESVNGLNVGLNDANLDLDGDGLSNLGEYAFGSDPNDFSDCRAPTVIRNASGFLEITFNRFRPADGSYQVQVSSTLNSWSSTQVMEEGDSTPSVQVWRDTFGGSPNPPPVRFIRVAFTSSL